MRTQEAFEHQPEADSFRFDGAATTLWRAVRAHRWVVVATALLTTVLVGLYIWIWPPIYQAEVMLAADSEQDIQRTAFYQGWNVFRREGLTDEATLMASPPVLREVVETLNLKYDDVYHPFMNYAVHLWAKSWVGRNYRKLKLRLLGETDQQGAGMTPEQLEFFRVLSDFEQGVTVRQVGEANIGLLIVRGPNQRVSEIANKIAEVYLRQRRERYVAEARQALESLSEEAAKAQVALDSLDLEIRTFRAESGAVLVFEQERGLIGQWLVMRSAVIDLEAAEADSVSALRALQQQLDQEGRKLRSDRVFRQDAEKDRLPRLQQQLLQARQSFQPDSREVREIEAQIQQAMRSVEEGESSVIVRNSLSVSQTYEALLAKKMALESGLAGTRAALQVKRKELTQLRALIDQIPEKMQRNREFERRQTTLENKYSGIAEKLTVATVSMASAKSAPPALRVVEGAHPPDKPVWPQSKLMFIAALIGGTVVGVIVALLLDVVFERVNRNRLSRSERGLRPFALVDQDERFLRTLFPRERAS